MATSAIGGWEKGATVLLSFVLVGFGFTQDSQQDTKVVEHVMGAAEIPVRPERVATNVETLVTNLLLLGIQPLTGPENQAGLERPLHPAAARGRQY